MEPRAWRRPHAVAVVLVLLLAKLELFRLLVFGVPSPPMLLADLAGAAALVAAVALLAPGRATVPALWLLNLLVSAFLVVAFLYFSYYQTLPTVTALQELDQAVAVRDSVAGLLDWRLVLFYADLAFAPAVALALHGGRWVGPRRRVGRERLLRLGTLALAGTMVTVVVVHAGADLRNERYRAEDLGVLGYEADALIRALNRPEPIDLATAYDRVSALQAAHHTTVTDPALARGFGDAAGKNLIMVQLESMQELVVGLEVGGQEVTPHLNRLIGESTYFPHHFQQVGKGNTVDAEFVSNTSIYPVGDLAMSTAYGERDLPSLPKLLHERGYVAETFNVNWARFWDHDKLFRGLGFDRWHQKDEFPGEQFNVWGVSDEEFYARSLDRLRELHRSGRRFYVQLVTASGHGPFEVPDDEIGIALPDGLRGTYVGDYLEAQNYADRALGQLIDGLRRSGIWDDSLFVAYGDHGGLNEQDTVAGGQALDPSYSFERRFNTPLVIHVPGAAPSREEKAAGELDILPTVANLLGISLAEERFVAFGVDLLNTDHHALGIRFHAPTGTFVNDEVLYLPGRGYDDGRAVSTTTGERRSLDGFRDDYDHVLDLMALSDGYVEALPKR